MRVRGQTCRMQRCKHPPAIDGICKSHALDLADSLFSAWVRSVGHCEVSGGMHSGNLQCAHGFPRAPYWSIRWDRRNAFCLCQGHHKKYTHDVLRWDDWILERWGFELYWELRGMALDLPRPDLELVLAQLKADAT